MMQHGTNIKAHESPSGEHDTTRSGARHSVYRGNSTSHSSNETIGTEHNMNTTERAVKSSEHIHRPRYKVRTSRNVAMTDEQVTMTTEHKVNRGRTEHKESVHRASNTGHQSETEQWICIYSL